MTNIESNWKDFLCDGNSFYIKAKHWQEIGKFNNDLIYNLILMSIEKNIMAICLKNNYLPENHTITDLLNALKRVVFLDNDLERKLLEIEKYQYICTVDDYNRESAEIKDINMVIDLGRKVNELAQAAD